MNPGGRPSKYTDELIQNFERYLEEDGCSDPVPSIAGLALHLGISRETCYAWAADEDKAEFAELMERLLAQQERALISGGLLNVFNANITKMMLTKHGYTDRQETTLTGANSGPIEVAYVGVSTDGRRSAN